MAENSSCSGFADIFDIRAVEIKEPGFKILDYADFSFDLAGREYRNPAGRDLLITGTATGPEKIPENQTDQWQNEHYENP